MNRYISALAAAAALLTGCTNKEPTWTSYSQQFTNWGYRVSRECVEGPDNINITVFDLESTGEGEFRHVARAIFDEPGRERFMDFVAVKDTNGVKYFDHFGMGPGRNDFFWAHSDAPTTFNQNRAYELLGLASKVYPDLPGEKKKKINIKDPMGFFRGKMDQIQ
jgi:hypothetical protein